MNAFGISDEKFVYCKNKRKKNSSGAVSACAINSITIEFHSFFLFCFLFYRTRKPPPYVNKHKHTFLLAVLYLCADSRNNNVDFLTVCKWTTESRRVDITTNPTSLRYKFVNYFFLNFTTFPYTRTPAGVTSALGIHSFLRRNPFSIF